MKKRFTIAEIREYFEGCILRKSKSGFMKMASNEDCTDDLPHNFALKAALRDLEDYQDGIEAVNLRRRKL